MAYEKNERCVCQAKLVMCGARLNLPGRLELSNLAGARALHAAQTGRINFNVTKETLHMHCTSGQVSNEYIRIKFVVSVRNLVRLKQLEHSTAATVMATQHHGVPMYKSLC